MRISTQKPEPSVRLMLEDQGKSNTVALIASWEKGGKRVHQVLLYFEGEDNSIKVEAVPLNRQSNPPFEVDASDRLIVVPL